MSRIDNTPLREAFEQSDLTAYEVARRLGCFCNRGGRQVPHDYTVKRMLGLIDYESWRGQRSRIGTVSVDKAERLCEILDLDPVDIGI